MGKDHEEVQFFQALNSNKMSREKQDLHTHSRCVLPREGRLASTRHHSSAYFMVVIRVAKFPRAARLPNLATYAKLGIYAPYSTDT